MESTSRVELEEIVKPLVKEKVFSAFKKVDRKLFVPVEFQKQAYLDRPLPLDNNSTISQPSLVAEMIDLLDLKGDEKVMEIGTGSGYSSAILSFCCKSVESIELNKKLAKEAKIRLKKLEFNNIEIHQSDGVNGFSSRSPYDVIIFTASINEIPKKILKQLKNDGKIIYPLQENKKDYQILMLGSKKEDKILMKRLFPVNFVHLFS